MNEKNIISPCISVCKTDPVTGFCYGCGRSDEDKSIWKDPETSINWKKGNILSIRERLTGWQLDAFDKSYANKNNNGMSLIKQKLIDLKK